MRKVIVSILFLAALIGCMAVTIPVDAAQYKSLEKHTNDNNKRVVCVYKGHGGHVKTKEINLANKAKTVDELYPSKIKQGFKHNTKYDLGSSTNIPKHKKYGLETIRAKEPDTKDIIAEPIEVDKGTFDIKLTFTGDIMIAAYKNQTKTGNFNDVANNNPPTYFLQNVASIFEDDDWTIVNLENVLTDNPLKETNKGYSPAYWYKSKTANTEILTSSSVEVVNLSNNHTNDYGSQGMTDTIKAVSDAGLEYGTSDKTVYLEKNGIRIALICNGLWNEGQADTIVKRIKEAEKDSDYQIVFYHGGTERVHTPENWRVRASRKLVDNGADLVIGNHPHVIQPMETYNGVNIFYSMGNFCFGDEKRAENRTIIYQHNIHIKDGAVSNYTGNVIPCYVYTAETNNYCPAPIDDEQQKQNVMDFLAWNRKSPV